MSRHALHPYQPGLEVVVGWDPPLATFFAQVIRPATDDGEDEVLLWLGVTLHEVEEPEVLRIPLAPWVALDDTILAVLRADRAGAAPASALQTWLLRLIEGNG